VNAGRNKALLPGPEMKIPPSCLRSKEFTVMAWLESVEMNPVRWVYFCLTYTFYK